MYYRFWNGCVWQNMRNIFNPRIYIIYKKKDSILLTILQFTLLDRIVGLTCQIKIQLITSSIGLLLICSYVRATMVAVSSTSRNFWKFKCQHIHQGTSSCLYHCMNIKVDNIFTDGDYRTGINFYRFCLELLLFFFSRKRQQMSG